MRSAYKNLNDLEAFRDIADDVDESEFVPYACLYDDYTVLTKNGELLQTIRISGLSYENIQHDSLDLRALLRQAISQLIPDDNYAVWFHTIRSKSDLRSPGTLTHPIANALNDSWNEKHSFSGQYTNDVYITLVREGQDARILSPGVFLRGLIPRIDIRGRNAYLDAMHAELDAVALKIEEALQPFGGERLGTVQEAGETTSELLRFLHRIINFADRPMPLVPLDLGMQLTPGEITFAFNGMEVRSEAGDRRFAAIMTLKDYKEKALTFIDRFLKLPMEFMVTQCVSFAEQEKARQQYQKLQKVQEIAEEKDLAKMMELDMRLASEHGRITDYGEQQMSLFILADSPKQLERNVRHTVNFLGRHGIICIREDLKFEESFWAQLPANFEFIRRMQPTAMNHVAGFANLYNHPVGLREHNHWGPAVTTLQTTNGTPYFFNFHIEEVGHTLVTGRTGAGKSTLVNFLITQASKFAPVVYYFDVNNQHRAWVESLGGKVWQFSSPQHPSDSSLPPLNPFSLPANEGNIRFIQRWLSVLLRCSGQSVSDADKQAMAEALRLIYGTEQARSLHHFCEILRPLATETEQKFSVWRRGGTYGHVFDHETDLFALPCEFNSFQLRDVLQDGHVIAPLLSYLLQRLTLSLDGRPTIIALDEAWQLLSQTHIAGEIDAWMRRLTEMNAITILQTSQIEEVAESAFTQTLMQHVATEMYLPDDLADDIYTDSFGLSDIELSYLELLNTEQRHILIKRMENTLIAEMNLHGLDTALSLLSGNNVQLKTGKI
ncbi:MAG: hypothetical protein K2Q12_02510 [Rickettsiales bacterium]|nr:hypothetical protein [Rickettsiales bacterium]